jgi:fucose permease
MWSQNSALFLNTLHFTFGVGTIAAPIIAQPFLSSHEKRWYLTIAYSICASICILSAIVLIILLVHHKYKAEEESQTIKFERRQSLSQSLSQQIVHESERYELSPKLGFICLIMGCLLLATYVAMEMTYFSFVPTFAQY